LGVLPSLKAPPLRESARAKIKVLIKRNPESLNGEVKYFEIRASISLIEPAKASLQTFNRKRKATQRLAKPFPKNSSTS